MRRTALAVAIAVGTLASLAPTPAHAGRVFVAGNYACNAPWKFRTTAYVRYATHHYLEPASGALEHYWPTDPNGYYYYTFRRNWGTSGWRYVYVDGSADPGPSAWGNVVCWQ